MSKFEIPWGGLIMLGAVAVVGYFAYTKIFKPLLGVQDAVSGSIDALTTQPSNMVTAVGGALGLNEGYVTVDNAQDIAKELVETLPDITPGNIITNPLETAIKGIGILPAIIGVLTMSKETKTALETSKATQKTQENIISNLRYTASQPKATLTVVKSVSSTGNVVNPGIPVLTTTGTPKQQLEQLITAPRVVVVNGISKKVM